MKAKNIRLYNGIFLSVFTCLLGVAFIAVTLVIFSEGNWQAGASSRDLVAKMLFPLSIPFYLWIAAIITGFVLSEVYPYKQRSVNKIKESVTLKRLAARLPEGSGEEYESDMRKITVEKRSRLIAYATCAAICFAGAIASGIFLLNPAHFAQSTSVNDSMLKVLANVGPWVLAAFAACVGLTLFEKYSMLREITILKGLISKNKGNPVVKYNSPETRFNAFFARVREILSSKYFLWSVRGVLAAVAVTFIILGVFNQGMRDVLTKAINICMECIGLG